MENSFIFRHSEFRTSTGQVKENFYVNRRSVPDSGALLHLRLWLDSEWNNYTGKNQLSESTAFLGLILSGVQQRRLSDDEQILHPGDLLLERQRNELLRFQSRPGEPLRRIGMLLSRTAAFDALTCALFPERSTIIRCRDPERMKKFFLAVKNEITESGGRAEIISQQLFALLQEIAAQRRQSGRPEPLRKALEYIDLNGFRPISREELAARAGVSVRTLTGLFQTVCGTSPGRYLCERRIAYAKELLSSRRLTVSDTAALAGFSSVEYFIREFRRHTGKTPGKY